MAGAVRQPIDVRSLSDYLKTNLPEIELPITLKQVGLRHRELSTANFR